VSQLEYVILHADNLGREFILEIAEQTFSIAEGHPHAPPVRP